jgi:predicted adenine nucleotide alpha hydrolase (AANH) superfamily ATPase
MRCPAFSFYNLQYIVFYMLLWYNIWQCFCLERPEMNVKEDKKTSPDCRLEKIGANVTEEIIGMGDETGLGRPDLLLHTCCGPCSTVCVERLVKDYNITVFFYNPNITDPQEYEKRKKAQISFINAFNEDPAYDGRVDFMEGSYDPAEFFAEAKGLEDEAEGGPRCGRCFELRLAKAAETASMGNFDCFTTSLTVSPHKDYDVISSIGRKTGMQYGISYLDMNFKKRDGFKRSVELSKKYGLYRQNYCGCEFSKWEEE